MSKLRCKCGHIIVDQTDSISHKGYILPDAELEDISNSFIDSVSTLLEAVKTEKLSEWTGRNFLPGYPTDLKESAMLYDLLTNHLVKKTQDIYECEACGRIWIQLGQKNEFKSFSPDESDNKGVLNSRR